MRKILVTGALGQIGQELVPELARTYGADSVLASDIRMPPGTGDGSFEHLDCTHIRHLQEIVRRFDVGTVYHLASLLSAVAEHKPQAAWDVNMGSLYRVLETARQYRAQVFFPSSIGAFGPTTPKDMTPQDTIQRPNTMYGVTKVAGELLGDYYAQRFAVDVRGLRLPGLISHRAPPGGGTTDYAVEMFEGAVRHRQYTCYLKPDTRLDMMYMPDAVRAIIEVMAADPARLVHRNAFNVTAMSFTPGELAAEIAKHVTGFSVDYAVDPVRQAIADSWPRSLDDGAARGEWGWRPQYDLAAMAEDMLANMAKKFART